MNTRPEWTDTFLDTQRQIGDPEADTLIIQLIEEEGPEQARQLFDQLIGQLELPLEDLPDSASNFIRQHYELPDWVAQEQVTKASDFFTDHGPKILFCLFYYSLPLLYSCKNGAQVLVRTSRLTNKEENLRIFARRIAETGQFLMDTMRPNGLNKGAPGIQAILKVRLIHAAIRFFVARGEWDQEQLGLPINQEDMALTLMTFCIAPIRGLEHFEIAVPAEDKEAYLHCWRGIGHLMGVDAQLLPNTFEEGAWLLDRILERQSASSEAGQLLTKALIDFGNRALNSEKLIGSPQAIMRFLLGPNRAKMLGVAPEGCLSQLVPGILRSAFNIGERLEDKFDGPMHLLIQHLSQLTADGLVDYFDDFPDRQFQIPLVLRKAWKQNTIQ